MEFLWSDEKSTELGLHVGGTYSPARGCSGSMPSPSAPSLCRNGEREREKEPDWLHIHPLGRRTGSFVGSLLPSSLSLTGPLQVLGIHCGFSRLKGPCAQGIVCAKRHGVHPVAMTLKSTTQHTLGQEKTGHIYTEIYIHT